MKKAKFVTLPANTQKLIEHTQNVLQRSDIHSASAGYYASPSVSNRVVRLLGEGNGELRIENELDKPGVGLVSFVHVHMMNPNLVAENTPQLDSLNKIANAMGLNKGASVGGVMIQGDQVAGWVKAILKAGFRNYGGSDITPPDVCMPDQDPDAYGYGGAVDAHGGEDIDDGKLVPKITGKATLDIEDSETKTVSTKPVTFYSAEIKHYGGNYIYKYAQLEDGSIPIEAETQKSMIVWGRDDEKVEVNKEWKRLVRLVNPPEIGR